MLDFSRRGLLAALGVASVPAVATVASPAKSVALTVLTPETYLAEMRAIGWRAFATVLNGEPLGGVVERGPSEQLEMFESWDDFRRIQMRVPVNDPTFWTRTAETLFRLGLHEEVRWSGLAPLHQ